MTTTNFPQFSLTTMRVIEIQKDGSHFRFVWDEALTVKVYEYIVDTYNGNGFVLINAFAYDTVPQFEEVMADCIEGYTQ